MMEPLIKRGQIPRLRRCGVSRLGPMCGTSQLARLPGHGVWPSPGKRLPLVLAMLSLGSFFSAPAIAQEPSRAPPEKQEKEKEELGEKLIRKATSDSDEDLMSEVVRLMNESARRLEIEYDPGEETQAVQSTIMDHLQEAIKIAAAQRRPQRSSGGRPKSDKREGTPPPGKEEGQESKSGQAADAADAASAAGGGQADGTGGLPSGQLDESRRGWGSLPERDRDAVIQGSGEKFLERYREMIERYYRALQQSDERP
jgi:hypothetical protein